jgi:hypothetical protein
VNRSRDRQYAHGKDGLVERGRAEAPARRRNEARQKGLKGRSAMDKAQLEAALTPARLARESPR